MTAHTDQTDKRALRTADRARVAALETLETEHTRLLALAAIVESSDDAIITETLDHVISSWNGGAEWIYGYSATEALGSLISILLPLGSEDEAPELLKRIAAGERIDHYETVRRRKDGREINVSLTASPVTDALGQIVGVSIVTRDISERAAHEAERSHLIAELEAARTELQARNERLETLEQLKSELVSTVSHELRTPLSVIRGFAKLLRTHETDEATRALYLTTLESEAERLAGMIDNFLDLQRIEAGENSVSPEPLELGALVTARVALFAGQSATHTFQLTVPEGPLNVLADPASIARALTNLLSNAVKYSPNGGQVDVTGESIDGAVRLSVRDTGVGIPADQQEHLFKRFFRVRSAETDEIVGTGLGLALCRELVEAQRGRVGFESTVGEGSTFWIELPTGAARIDA